MYVQLFSGWRYKAGARDRIDALGLGDTPSPVLRPDVPGLLARLLATKPGDPDTGIGLWVWENEAACRAYEESMSPDAAARLDSELDTSAMIKEAFDALLFGVRAA